MPDTEPMPLRLARLRSAVDASNGMGTMLVSADVLAELFRQRSHLAAELEAAREALRSAEAVLVRAAAMAADLAAPATLKHDLAAALPPVREALAGLGQAKPPQDR